MPDSLKVITNHHERKVIEAWELPKNKRSEFDYLNWTAIDAGNDSAQFISYRGEIYDLSEFSRAPESLNCWDEYMPDSYFSGVVVKYVRDGKEIDFEYVIVGRYFA